MMSEMRGTSDRYSHFTVTTAAHPMDVGTGHGAVRRPIAGRNTFLTDRSLDRQQVGNSLGAVTGSPRAVACSAAFDRMVCAVWFTMAAAPTLARGVAHRVIRIDHSADIEYRKQDDEEDREEQGEFDQSLAAASAHRPHAGPIVRLKALQFSTLPSQFPGVPWTDSTATT